MPEKIDHLLEVLEVEEEMPSRLRKTIVQTIEDITAVYDEDFRLLDYSLGWADIILELTWLADMISTVETLKRVQHEGGLYSFDIFENPKGQAKDNKDIMVIRTIALNESGGSPGDPGMAYDRLNTFLGALRGFRSQLAHGYGYTLLRESEYAPYSSKEHFKWNRDSLPQLDELLWDAQRIWSLRARDAVRWEIANWAVVRDAREAREAAKERVKKKEEALETDVQTYTPCHCKNCRESDSEGFKVCLHYEVPDSDSGYASSGYTSDGETTSAGTSEWSSGSKIASKAVLQKRKSRVATMAGVKKPR